MNVFKEIFSLSNLTFQIDRLLRLRYFFKLRVSLFSIERGSHNFTYRGVVCRKNPIDLALIQEIIHDIAPDIIIEIGTNYGGSALYYADLLNANGLKSVVHSIDIQNFDVPQVVRMHPKIELFSGGYQNYNTENLSIFKRKLIIDDGSHIFSDVYAALEKFYPLLHAGDYYIVEDGSLNFYGWSRHYFGGPIKAVRKFLAEKNDMVLDTARLYKFGRNGSSNHLGYLQKVTK